MTPDEIRIECAKLDGWELALDFNKYASSLHQCLRKNRMDGWQPIGEVPDYPNSYDAILPLIQKQDFKVKYQCALYVNWSFDATPLELCIALLKAKGLYHD